MQHLLVIVSHQREFEPVLCRIERDSLWARGAVEAMNCLSLDTSEIHWVVECADDAVISAEIC
jgi:hypothetical protein